MTICKILGLPRRCNTAHTLLGAPSQCLLYRQFRRERFAHYHQHRRELRGGLKQNDILVLASKHFKRGAYTYCRLCTFVYSESVIHTTFTPFLVKSSRCNYLSSNAFSALADSILEGYMLVNGCITLNDHKNKIVLSYTIKYAQTFGVIHLV